MLLHTDMRPLHSSGNVLCDSKAVLQACWILLGSCAWLAVEGFVWQCALQALWCRAQCEADAVAFTEEAQHGLQPQSELPITPSGSYVLAPASMEAKDLRLEVCMARPSSGPLVPRLRTRVVFSLRRKQSDGSWELQDIQVQEYNIPGLL